MAADTDEGSADVSFEGVIERSDGSRYLDPVRAQAFLGLIRAGDKLERALEATLQREHDLSLHAFEVLLFLSVFCDDREMSMSELRRRTPLSQSRVSRLVARLEADELVARVDDPSDTRAINVRITNRGVTAFRAAQDRHLDDLEHHLFSKLTSREIRQLASITNKILGGPTRQNGR